MLYKEKLFAVKGWVEENITTVEEFCVMFDITLEDMIKCFSDPMVKNYSKVFAEEPDENEEEAEAWAGYSIAEEE
jgi:hypothetical protein